MSGWTHILTASELEDLFAKTAALDPSYAARQRRFYENASDNDLRALMHQAWLCNEPDGYQLARSYMAQRGLLTIH